MRGKKWANVKVADHVDLIKFGEKFPQIFFRMASIRHDGEKDEGPLPRERNRCVGKRELAPLLIGGARPIVCDVLLLLHQKKWGPPF